MSKGKIVEKKSSMGQSKKHEIIKDVLHFTSARYISQGIGFFTAIAMRKFLGPFYMGIWSLLRVVLGYTSYLFLGIDKGAANRIPFLAGQGDNTEEEDVKNNTFSFIMLVSILTGIGMLVAAILLRGKYPTSVTVGLCALSVYLIVSKYCTFYQVLLRAKHNFTVLSKAIVFEAVINLVLILLLVSNFKIYGLYAVLILVAALNILYMHRLARYKVQFALNKDKIRGLIKIGLPITVVGLLQWVLGSLDRIMIAKMIGVTFVGYYSIPIMAKSYVGHLSSFGTVLYPRLMKTYGEEQNIENIKKYVTVPTMINAYILPSILGMMFFIVPLLIYKILPKFVPGILAMQILLLEMFFYSCQAQSFYFIVAMKKQIRVIPLVVGAIFLNFIGNYTLIKMGYSIYGVAWATSAVTFLSFVALQGYAMKLFTGWKEIFIFVLKIVAPLFYTTVVVLCISKFVIMENVYVELIAKILLLLAASTPLFVYINRKTEVINLLFNVIRKKLTKGR